MNSQNLYFIAIIPPPPLFNKIQFIKEYIAQKYECKQALKSPPHITLVPPFKYKEKKELLLVKAIEQFNQQQKNSPLNIKLDNFDVFLPKVIYINVIPSFELVMCHQNILKMTKVKLKIIKDKDPRPFHPHITIAFRDVKKNILSLIIEDLKEHFVIEDNFICTQISLLKHNGIKWEIFKS